MRRRGLHCESCNYNAEPQTERNRFMKKVRFLGLDVHADTIAVAVAEPDGKFDRWGSSRSRRVGSQTG